MSNNTVTWFEVATDEPKVAEEFYGELFGWTFGTNADPEEGKDYRMISAGGSQAPVGGLLVTAGRLPNHAVFYVQVADVREACTQAEKLGGTVVQSSPDTPTPFAYLKDRSGNLFGVFSPAAQ